MSALPVENDRPKLNRGWKRMRELRQEAAAEISALTAELLKDLGRPASAIDRVAIETLSAAMIRARRLRQQGKSDTEQTRLIAQLLRTTGLKPDRPGPQKVDPVKALDAYIASKQSVVTP